MARTKGAKAKKPYNVSPLALVQRRTVNLKHGKTKNSMIGTMTNCESCPTAQFCESRDKVMADAKDKSIPLEKKAECPLFMTYKEAFLNVLKNPIMDMARDIATLQVKMAQQNMKDGQEDTVISKEFVQAMKLKLEASKVYNATMKNMHDMNKKGTAMNNKSVIDEDMILDVEFDEVEEEQE